MINFKTGQVKFFEENGRTILKEKNEILGFISNTANSGFSFSVKNENSTFTKYIGKKALSKSQAKCRLISEVIKLNN